MSEKIKKLQEITTKLMSNTYSENLKKASINDSLKWILENNRTILRELSETLNSVVDTLENT